MNETGKNNEAANEIEDWAIIPFDEAEDDARWEQLIEDTDKLIAEAEEIEAVHGELLMENKLSVIETTEKVTEEELF
jgi:hypothetical protein